MSSMWKVAVIASVAIVLSGGDLAGADEAPLLKSGTAVFDTPVHYSETVYKASDKQQQSSGQWWGILVPRADSKFLKGAKWEGAFGAFYHDLEKGVQTRTAIARVLDGDQDAVFTSQHCKMNSWTDWCATTIEGGTGKYEGITGTMRWMLSFETPWFNRTTPDGARPAKSRFDAEGEGILIVEISWKLP